MAASTNSSTSTMSISGSFSAPCSRDSAISSLTMLPSRVDSVTIFSPKWCTDAGSSADSSSASASRLSAPTGVFSSWLTLATKSRRVASIRACSVSSSANTTARRWSSSVSRRAVPRTAIGFRPVVLRSHSVISPDANTRRAAVHARSSRSMLRTTPSSSARGLCSTTSRCSSTTAIPLRETSTIRSSTCDTVIPAADSGSGAALRRLSRYPAPRPPATSPAIPATTATSTAVPTLTAASYVRRPRRKCPETRFGAMSQVGRASVSPPLTAR